MLSKLIRVIRSVMPLLLIVGAVATVVFPPILTDAKSRG